MTTDVVTKLTERVKRLEQAVFARRLTYKQPLQHDSTTERSRTFQRLLEQQGITNQSIGAEKLQKMLEQEHLELNEMSHTVREMREE